MLPTPTQSVLIIALGCWLGTLCAACQPRRWPWELATHFRLQYVWISLLAGVWLAWRQHWWAVGLSVLCAGVNLPYVLALYRRPTITPAPGASPTCRVFFANLLMSNRSHRRLLAAIHRFKPDLVVLEEFTQEWLAALGDVAAEYPHSEAVIMARGYGVAVFSRLPFEHTEVLYLHDAGPPPVVVGVRIGGRTLRLIATHPLSPMSPWRAYYRDRQMDELAKYLAQRREPTLVIGDFNMTSWTPVYQEFLRRTGLRDSRQGFGVLTTWPAGVPLLRITLDHCLVSPDVLVHRRQVGPYVGSDHYPIVVDCSLAPHD